LSCHKNEIGAAALNTLFGSLHGNGGEIICWGNPGAAECDTSIATAKGWKVSNAF
jgi:hypothetical protein